MLAILFLAGNREKARALDFGVCGREFVDRCWWIETNRKSNMTTAQNEAASPFAFRHCHKHDFWVCSQSLRTPSNFWARCLPFATAWFLFHCSSWLSRELIEGDDFYGIFRAIAQNNFGCVCVITQVIFVLQSNIEYGTTESINGGQSI